MTECSRFATIQLATYTDAEWAAANPTLKKGQVAFSSDALYDGTDQMKFKVGNGTDTWSNLDYMPMTGSVLPYIILLDNNTPAHKWKVQVDLTGALYTTDLGVA